MSEERKISSSSDKKVRRKKEKKPLPVFLRVLGRIFSFIFGVIATILAIFIITGCIVGVSLTTYVMSFVDVEQTINLRDLDLNYTTILYANDPDTGNTYELKRLQGEENRIWVDLENIPQHVVDALTSVEDERFFQHNGVDWKRTLAAFLNEYVMDLYGGRQGASTITQQLVKNLTGQDDVRVERKLQEIFTAIQLEKEYSKDDILEAYLNRVHFGNNTNGIQAASNLYFGKDVSELDIAEAAAIVGITQYPSYYDPLRHPENNKERQLYVLQKMFELGKITELEYEMAKVETLNFVGKTGSSWTASLTWFEDALIYEIVNDLMEQKGYSESYAYDQVYNGGLRIYTTLNQDVQDALDHVFVSGEIFPTQTTNGEPDEVQPEASGIVMDMNGAIVGLSGGIGEKTEDLLFSRATGGLRQPGSTMKPIGAYGPAIEYNLITYSTVIEDAPIDLKEGDKIIKWPTNYYNAYLGNMTAVEALSRSVNTVAVRVGQLVTPERSFDFVKNTLHVDTLVESKIVNGEVKSDIQMAPMFLGSPTDGVTLEELVGAYQIFGNGGLYNKPHTYTQVLDYNGNVVLENAYAPSRAISEESATIMNRMLQQVMYGPNGTGRSAVFDGQPLGGKTGTTSDDKDHWFIGMSPYYVTAVWWGYDIPETLHYYSYHPPMRAWRSVMSEIHEDLPTKEFPYSNNVIQMSYCNETGLIAGPDCPSTQVGYYKANNIPDTCDHKNVVGSGNEDGEENSGPGSLEEPGPGNNWGQDGSSSSSSSSSSTESWPPDEGTGSGSSSVPENEDDGAYPSD